MRPRRVGVALLVMYILRKQSKGRAGSLQYQEVQIIIFYLTIQKSGLL